MLIRTSHDHSDEKTFGRFGRIQKLKVELFKSSALKVRLGNYLIDLCTQFVNGTARNSSFHLRKIAGTFLTGIGCTMTMKCTDDVC